MITNRLDNPEVLDLINKSKLDQIFMDIDYTVLEFESGNMAGVDNLNKTYGGLGDRVNQIFKLVLEGKRNFETLNEVQKEEYKQLMIRFGKIQSKFLDKGQSVKYWSRESMIIIAAQDLGLELKDEVEVENLSLEYWQSVANFSKIYEDAIGFLDKIKSEGIPIIWVSGSDSVLVVSKKDGKIELDYDPEYSWKSKERRIKILLEKYPGKLVVGDPVEKPELWYQLLRDIEIERTLVVGDSYEADLMVAEKMGIKTVLIKR